MTGATLFSGGGGADIGMSEAGVDMRWGIELGEEITEVAQQNDLPIHQGDLTEEDPSDWPAVDCLHASPPCFPSETTVLCEDGLKEISEVKVGDRVVTHKGRYKEVTNVMSRKASTIVLEGLGHWGIETTPNHPFLASEIVRTYPPHEERKSGNYVNQHMHSPTYIPACMLQGKHWLSLREYPNSTAPKIELHSPRSQKFNLNNTKFWEFVGLWVGDGWARQRDTSHTTSVCAGYHEREDAKSILDEAGIKYSVEEAKTTVKFRIYSKGLTKWLVDNFNQHAHAKELPTWLLGLPEDKRHSFLRGYLFADGCKQNPENYKNEVFIASTVSRQLGIGLRMLGLSLGYSVSLKRYERSRENAKIEGRKVNERPTYTLRFSQTKRHSRPIGQYRGGAVRSTRDGRKSVTVYDITVADDHSFVADGLVVHNCPSFSVAKTGGEETDEDVSLAESTCRFIRGIEPTLFSLENVYGYRKSESWRLIRRCLKRKGYKFNAWKLNAADYGVPQTRKRMIVAAIRGGPRPTKPSPTHAEDPPTGGLFDDTLEEWVGWHEAIEDLIPGLPETELADWQKERLPDELTTELVDGGNAGRNGTINYNPETPPPTITGGRTPRAILVKGSAIGSNEDISSKVAEPTGVVKKETGQRDVWRAVLVSNAFDTPQGGDDRKPQTYDDKDPSPPTTIQHDGRLRAVLVGNNANTTSGSKIHRDSDEPCLTVRKSTGGNNLKGVTRRVVQMAPRALARFQSFPDGYNLPDKKGLACRIIGNAVPPLLQQKCYEHWLDEAK